MRIIGKRLSKEEFEEYAKTYAFGSIRPSSLVLHHTWRPTKENWRGAVSIQGLKSYYESLGWNAGPHLFVAEDGIWLFTPMNAVGIHAGEGNSTYKWGRLQGYSIGIEVVGDYDIKPWEGETKTNALSVVSTLMRYLELDKEGVFFHRDFG